MVQLDRAGTMPKLPLLVLGRKLTVISHENECVGIAFKLNLEHMPYGHLGASRRLGQHAFGEVVWGWISWCVSDALPRG